MKTPTLKEDSKNTYRTSISLPRGLHRAGCKKASTLKWGFSTYVQSLIEKDLAQKSSQAVTA